ncbi:hypothetical protein Q7P37_011011 [Cladosporium fusiforme]
MLHSPNAVRQRAPKACVRCNQKKLKCDAVRSKGPCSRCRMDHIEGCVLGTSRRGTYERKAQHRACFTRGPKTIARSQQVPETIVTRASGDDVTDCGQLPCNDRRSLVSLFESFVEQNGYEKDTSTSPQQSIMLLGEHSPLTFALTESQRQGNLHDVSVDLTKSKALSEHAREGHPTHVSALDIRYLQDRGTFTTLDETLEKQLISAFMSRFYPLYSLVDKDEVLELHKDQKLPWILLHAICLIGATFCDASIINKSGFESRLHARKTFYDKAKVLFDFEYEKDRVVLLQTVIMLSFWGPHMDNPWNPASWVGFGVTIAASLGMHRASSSTYATGKDKSLVKRIWWSLCVRDAYCSALMGRPARIDMTQCDTEALEPADFCEDQATVNENAPHALYQMHAAQLSMIVRQMIAKHPIGNKSTVSPQDFCEMLSQWRAQLPRVLAFDAESSWNGNIFATCLKILYHYHIIFVHLKRPGHKQRSLHTTEVPPLAEESAQIISSTASMLVTKRLITQVPHEVFTGIFMAGIVFSRQLRQADLLVSRMAKASLTNCQLMLNEARELFDPTSWVIRIFDFLLSNKPREVSQEKAPDQQEPVDQALSGESDDFNFSEIVGLGEDSGMLAAMNELYATGWPQTTDGGGTSDYNDMWLMPNFLSTL